LSKDIIVKTATAVDTVECAALLGIKPQSVRRWACTGTGPIKPRRMFGRPRWAVDDINAVLNGGAA
jgi:hypothetical protein